MRERVRVRVRVRVRHSSEKPRKISCIGRSSACLGLGSGVGLGTGPGLGSGLGSGLGVGLGLVLGLRSRASGAASPGRVEESIEVS